jgi:DHA1 family multidrug resistance protein-like MFS transporter
LSWTEKFRSRMFLTLCIMGFFSILSSTMSKSPVLKPYSLNLGTPTDLTGVVAAASTIAGIIISLPAASLSDILGKRKFLLIAGFVFASAPFLYLLITVWWQLIIIRFYHGFATAIFVPVAEATVAEFFPTKRGERIALFSTATYIGRVIAPTIGGTILFATANNFHILYLAVGIAGATALITALPFSRNKKLTKTDRINIKETGKRLFAGWKVVVKTPGVLAVSFVQACTYYAYGSAEFYLAGYLPEIAHLNELLTGIIITSIIAVAIFTRPYLGRLSDKAGRRIPILAGCIVSSLPLLIVPVATDFWVLFLLVMIYGVGFAAVIASTSALISELVSKEFVGTSMGFIDTIMDVGQTAGPIISGLILSTNLHYTGLFFSLTFVLLLSTGTFALFGVTDHR